jgi:hypothetical protein
LKMALNTIKQTNKRRYRPPQYNWNIVESGVKHHQTNVILLKVALNTIKQT